MKINGKNMKRNNNQKQTRKSTKHPKQKSNYIKTAQSFTCQRMINPLGFKCTNDNTMHI